MKNSIALAAGGKLNLTLGITGRRADGYHTLCSVMQSIALANRITLTRTDMPGLTLRSDDSALPTDARNTAYRAAAAFFAAIQAPPQVEIFLEKRIPYQAGLGSASADAAGVLQGLNLLWDKPLAEEQLRSLGLSVGADVPFCLAGGTQLATGIGEVLSPLPPLPDCGLLLLHPGFGVSTPEAYRRYDALPAPLSPNHRAIQQGLDTGNLTEIAGHCGNAFTDCVDSPVIAEMKAALLAVGALGAEMTGSGTAVFGIFPDESHAAAAAERLSDHGWRHWVTKTSKNSLSLV